VVGGRDAGGVGGEARGDGALQEREEQAVGRAVGAEGRGVEDGGCAHEQASPPRQRGFPRRRGRIHIAFALVAPSEVAGAAVRDKETIQCLFLAKTIVPFVSSFDVTRVIGRWAEAVGRVRKRNVPAHPGDQAV
jgi:hypothetical protein